MDASTGGVAGFIIKESVSISKASTPKEGFALVMDRVVVVSQLFPITTSRVLSKVTSFSCC